jgi:predicted anti-sigma-YlaC factor YlaD
MADRHWSDEDLLAWLYGIGPQDGHLDLCESCRGRWEELQLRRARLLAREPWVPQDLLAAQRRSIYERLERKQHWLHLQLVHALAALLLVFVILTVFRPVPRRQPVDTASDDRVFEDVFEIATSTEPSAVEPVQSLFEVQQ